MSFIQILEFKTSKIDEMRERAQQYLADTEGKRTGGKGTVCQDRDNPGQYLLIVEFPSYEEAMKNSEMPETQAMAEDMQKLGDGPPIFRNLDVVEEWA